VAVASGPTPAATRWRARSSTTGGSVMTDRPAGAAAPSTRRVGPTRMLPACREDRAAVPAGEVVADD